MATNEQADFAPNSHWQQQAFYDTSLVLLMDGPAGSGKSHIAAHKLDTICRMYPGVTALAVRKTRQSMTNSTLLFLEHQVIKGAAKLNKSSMRWEYPNGSLLAYGGMKDEGQRQAIRSIGLDGGVDVVWMEEATLFTLADFEELLPRLRGRAAPFKQLILTTNPDSDRHWIYKKLIKGREASRYASRTSDNTALDASYETVILARLTGVRKKRLKDGIWSGAEGAVYEDYRYETHVIEPFEIPAHWRRYRAIDFGFTNPFVCQWWAVDEDGRMYLYREIYMSRRIVADHAEQINALSAGERIEYTVSDHDAEDRATLHRAGIRTRPAYKARKDGIEAAQQRFRIQEDGRPRIFLFNDALVEVDDRLADQKLPTCTIDEIAGYEWQPDIDGKANKEAPQEHDDHAMDSMRYMVAALDIAGPAKATVRKGNPFFGG
jgi:phage terminase large subunit